MPQYTISCIAPLAYPIIGLKGSAYCDNRKRDIYFNPIDVLGEEPHTLVFDGKYNLPEKIELAWLSVIDKNCYAIEADIDKQKAEQLWKDNEESEKDASEKFKHIICGILPNKLVGIYLYSKTKSILFQKLKARDFNISNELVSSTFIESECGRVLTKNEDARKSSTIGLPPTDIFDHWMEQFTYRFIPLEEYFNGESWQEYDEDDLFYDDIMVNELHVQRFDGTHHQLPDDFSLIKYHEAGMPKRMALHWDEGRCHLSAYWWFDDQVLYPVLHRFFSLDPTGRADLLLRLDSRQGRFEIALKGGEILQNPIGIPHEAYQLIVFKDGHELYKSPNFVQEDGAWFW